MEPIAPRDCDSPYPSSELVLHIPIFCHCLHIMMMLAQRLPVALIPEQFHISTMRNDMIYDCSLGYLSLSVTSHAYRMSLKEPLSCLLPFVSISTITGIIPISFMYRLMFLTIALPVRNQSSTSRMFAWDIRSHWHNHHLHYKSPARIAPSGLRSFYTFVSITISYVQCEIQRKSAQTYFLSRISCTASSAFPCMSCALLTDLLISQAISSQVSISKYLS